MTAIALSPADLALAAGLVAAEAALSVALRLHLHRQVLWAAARMVVQLLAVGYLLRFVLAISDPLATSTIVAAMALVAAREIAVRPERRLAGVAGFAIAGVGVLLATVATTGLALATVVRPDPWYDPRYAIPLAGIVLGSVLNAGSLTLDGLIDGIRRDRVAIEARLGLGARFKEAVAPVFTAAMRRGLLPIVNQMSAAGIITLPGIMTGQIIAGMDPVEAVKYQILLMFLLAGASGLASLVIAWFTLRRLTDGRERLRLDRLS